ncbi:Rpr2-domain-containing protein [Aspergillus sclerotioniger CBS 115572]|uniref:Rpr2-domain-containing protein n=1 Tax=Aspergillus sclerotioniger CBS 115572 TaxID=1450535 RepID=A0A317WYT0_9EURO|nr:Rpr2-domain-containing protein [Aspergillus sclerotioniger CBS 115572]PWY90492.1 Rpr2-domain-containing protein [Aspergillus sclerotioniger CBS 115572]
MAKTKVKGKKDSAGGAHSHIRARINYLYNAATFLQSVATPPAQQQIDKTGQKENDTVMQASARIVPQLANSETVLEKAPAGPSTQATTEHLPQLSRVYMSQMRGVSLKTQLRLPVDVKRSFCKRCDTRLIPGVTCMQEIRNASRGRKKPWADVLVVCCSTCGTEKRFPQAEKRSRKLSERRKDISQHPREEPTVGA